MRIRPVALAAALAALVSPVPAAAQAGAARYAGAQLDAAQWALRQAHVAAARANFASAGNLAWQASVDARLAWAMADSSLVREDAAEVARDAAALIAGIQDPEDLRER